MNQQTTAAATKDDNSASPSSAPAVVLVGLNGFGRQHLINIQRLVGEEKISFLAGIDPNDPGSAIRGENTRIFSSLDEFIDSGLKPDIIIISTPINTHADLALKALVTGADLYLEKPPTATLEQYETLLSAAQAAGVNVQVGFQALGSLALKAVAEFFESGSENSPIGALRAVGASGNWLRTTGYYNRSPWAGHRQLNGIEIADGVVTNPLAHAVASALRIAGAQRSSDVISVATDLYHAHQIEADDTSVVKLQTTTGIPVTAALTVCAKEQQDPWITIYGTEGSAVLYYTRDELIIKPNPDLGRSATSKVFDRVNLLENLVDVRAGVATELLSSLESAGAFMRVLEQIRIGPEPTDIPEEYVIPTDDGDQFHPVIPDIEHFIDRSVAAQSNFSSLGAPWAAEPESSGKFTLEHPTTGQKQVVARLRTGEDIAVTNSPRPFLDELTTLGGVHISDQQPLDHTWHLGVGVAIQDVNGNNFWGGRTYTRADSRYVWREDHGHIRTLANSFAANGSSVNSQLEWVGHQQHVLLDEQRTVDFRTFTHSSVGATGWIMDFTFSLSAREQSVSLGSPGSNGRPKGGYGGFFWRMPRNSNPQIFTDSLVGEEQVHGSLSPWLAFSADFFSEAVGLSQRGTGHGEATLIFCSDEGDPWFVRSSGYPGVGSSLAWDAPVVLEPGTSLTRRLRVLVVDGRLNATATSALVQEFGADNQKDGTCPRR
ncbi:PmoA family protein [Glutamicibacter ectropisis]|uniref:PmoA family protein n=1 Tax=Glutamicibacter ectropisis TaxID=3046593 RepID=A0AAU6WE30_9MICC